MLKLADDSNTQAAFAGRCKEIAQAESLDGSPLSAYVRLAAKRNCNFRAMLQAVEAGEMRE